MTVPSATIDMAHALANLSDDERIEGWVAELEPSLVPLALWLAEDFERRARTICKMASSRMIGENLLSSGEVWHSPDGDDYFWGGDRRREISDPDALRSAVEPFAIWNALTRAAFKEAFVAQPCKVYLTPLDRLLKFVRPEEREEAEQTIRSFVKWIEGPAKLRKVDEQR